MKKILNLLIIIGLLIPIKLYSQDVPRENSILPSSTEQIPDTLITSDTTQIALNQNQKNKKKDKKDKEKKAKDKEKKKNSKKVTFETFDVNYAKAKKYYENSQYLSAARLFEELYPLSLGTPVADTLLYLFADCYYKNKDYELAAFHFKDYAKHYPGTSRAEEAHYMCVKSVFEVSPIYSVDQSSTLYAIDELDLFIKTYPRSTHADECNKMLDLLREKLAQKDFEIAKLYYNTDNFQAAQIAVKNFLKDHPSSKFADEAVFILVKNNHEYAKKSVEAKKRERFQACIDAFGIMKARYPNSPFYSDAKKLSDDAVAQIEKIKNKNKNQNKE